MKESEFKRKGGEEYAVVISRKRRRHGKYECYDFTVVSEYDPSSVYRYMNLPEQRSMRRGSSELRDDVRRHLSAIGWTFWSKVKRGTDEWRYDSPTGKTYYSLMTACTAISEGIETNTTFDDPQPQPQPQPKPTTHACYVADQVKSKRRKGFGNKSSSSSIMGKGSGRILRSSKGVRQAEGGCSGSKIPRTVLSWLIEKNVVVPRSRLYYKKGGKRDDDDDDDAPLMEGRISSEGIKCNCCQILFSLSGFQAHVAGNNTCCSRPTENLFLEDGKSLVSCQLKLMKDRVRSFDNIDPSGSGSASGSEKLNDYVCSVCHHGGDLVLCDGCPSSFHACCLSLQKIPEGDWFCPSCCCGICGDSHQPGMEAAQCNDDSLLRCHQCERQYHARCKEDRGMAICGEHWFCCKACEMIQWGLQQLLGKPILVGHDNLTWTLIKPMEYQAEDFKDNDLVAMAENHSKLCVALEVMHECFDPVKDPKTKRDLVEDALFCRGSNLNRLNCRGFHTVLLERNDELIAVALLRIYGDKVAEMPLIGTRFQHRRLGMCRVLLNEIEKTLLKLGVQKLVLPAASSVVNTWINSFGFTPLTESDRLEFLGFTFLDFQDTIMCQKILRKPPSPRILLSRNMPVFHHKPSHIMDGSSIHHEGSSSMSEVLQKEQHQGSDDVDQGAEANVTQKIVDQEKFECDKFSLKLKLFGMGNTIEPRPLVPQTNHSNFDVSRRLVSAL